VNLATTLASVSASIFATILATVQQQLLQISATIFIAVCVAIPIATFATKLDAVFTSNFSVQNYCFSHPCEILNFYDFSRRNPPKSPTP
jgi:hypothetical protein